MVWAFRIGLYAVDERNRDIGPPPAISLGFAVDDPISHDLGYLLEVSGRKVVALDDLVVIARVGF